jgi:hypothetical protein
MPPTNLLIITKVMRLTNSDCARGGRGEEKMQ